MKNRGIVTIATGNERYYKMAINLLKSIKVTNPGLKTAIITDLNNKTTEMFDDVVILKEPNNSYLDKIDLLVNCPYDENIFIDADSLVYGDLSYLWEIFKSETDFSCFGQKLPIDSKAGFFTYGGVREYGDLIHYIANLHGGLYFIRKSCFCEELWKLCLKIKENYTAYTFRTFKESADEPIIALACALKNVSLIDRLHDICFLPIAKLESTNISEQKVEYIENGKKWEGVIVHFGNRNTEKARYKYECDKFSIFLSDARSPLLRSLVRLKYWMYLFDDTFGSWNKAKCTIYEMCPSSVQNIWHRLKSVSK